MGQLNSLKRYFFESKLTKTLSDYLRAIWTKINERALNIQSVDPDLNLRQFAHKGSREKTDGKAVSRNRDIGDYESPDYWYLRKIARLIRKEVSSDDVFVDIGSGKGRILCLMAQLPFKKVIGIEIRPDLCEVARSNAERSRGKKCPIEIVCGDASVMDYSEGTYFFMFNPFGEKTMSDVLLSIKNSLKSHPRQIRLIYYNAVHESLFEKSEWLVHYHHFFTATDRKVSFWRNTALPN
ncbi:MAG: class I SAM-dependent methyltransferase [Calditrichaeota bacterium]|nr:class I SAM-dependent methyltransferase [Calditrichota bacterium]